MRPKLRWEKLRRPPRFADLHREGPCDFKIEASPPQQHGHLTVRQLQIVDRRAHIVDCRRRSRAASRVASAGPRSPTERFNAISLKHMLDRWRLEQASAGGYGHYWGQPLGTWDGGSTIDAAFSGCGWWCRRCGWLALSPSPQTPITVLFPTRRS